MARFAAYIEPIIEACILFLPVAALFTLPFMVYQYRKYGSIPSLRVLIIYSFILYMMCSFLLTVLPLPTYEEVLAMKDKAIQLIPFSSYRDALRSAGLHLSTPEAFVNPRNWQYLLRSGGFFEILANIIMQIPLGIYLRYYFCKNWKQTLLIGLSVSLFFELTQLTGLWSLYPKAYRIASVDDLIDNTLGCMIGFWITPFFSSLLPTREELDSISIARDRKATIMRRITAAVIDWVIFLSVITLPKILNGSTASSFFLYEAIAYILWLFLYCNVLQYYWKGGTIGKWLLRIRVRDSETKKQPKFTQLLIRYLLIYIAAPLLICLLIILSIVLIYALLQTDQFLNFVGILGFFLMYGGTAYGLVHFLRKHHELPHSVVSGTRIITIARSDKARERKRRLKEIRRRITNSVK